MKKMGNSFRRLIMENDSGSSAQGINRAPCGRGNGHCWWWMTMKARVKSLQLFSGNDSKSLLAETVRTLNCTATSVDDAAISIFRIGGNVGDRMLEKLKAADPAIEAIMLTRLRTVESIRGRVRLGACDYLSKPFDMEVIRSAVAESMERRSLPRKWSNAREDGFIAGRAQQQTCARGNHAQQGKIYASVLHDINGPLTIIAGYIQLINMDLENTARRKRESRHDQRSSAQINRQINHLPLRFHNVTSDFCAGNLRTKPVIQVTRRWMI